VSTPAAACLLELSRPRGSAQVELTVKARAGWAGGEGACRVAPAARVPARAEQAAGSVHKRTGRGRVHKLNRPRGRARVELAAGVGRWLNRLRGPCTSEQAAGAWTS
jgi:hypothetical protein